jgi:YkoY family integral membrane protein
MDLMLGIDNLLVIGAMAAALPEGQRVRAIRIGLLFAIILRVVCLIFATWIASSTIIMLLGGSYLLYLGWDHFRAGGDDDVKGTAHDRFVKVIASIGFADLSFSIDNIVGAVGISKDIWVVGAGVVVAMLVMMFASQVVSSFIAEYPTLKDAAYVIIVLIGVKIFAETLLHVHLGEIVALATFLLIVSYAFVYDFGHRKGRTASSKEAPDVQ